MSGSFPFCISVVDFLFLSGHFYPCFCISSFDQFFLIFQDNFEYECFSWYQQTAGGQNSYGLNHRPSRIKSMSMQKANSQKIWKTGRSGVLQKKTLQGALWESYQLLKDIRATLEYCISAHEIWEKQLETSITV